MLEVDMEAVTAATPVISAAMAATLGAMPATSDTSGMSTISAAWPTSAMSTTLTQSIVVG